MNPEAMTTEKTYFFVAFVVSCIAVCCVNAGPPDESVYGSPKPDVIALVLKVRYEEEARYDTLPIGSATLLKIGAMKKSNILITDRNTICDPETNTRKVYPDIYQNIYLVLNRYEYRDSDRKETRQLTIRDVICFDLASPRFSDLALIELTEWLDVKEYGAATLIPHTKYDVSQLQNCTAYGWGVLSYVPRGYYLPSGLHEHRMQIVPTTYRHPNGTKTACHGQIPSIGPSNVFCTRCVGSQPCTLAAGDTGAALTCFDPKSRQRILVAVLKSRTSNDDLHAGPPEDWYSTFTNVTGDVYQNWLKPLFLTRLRNASMPIRIDLSGI